MTPSQIHRQRMLQRLDDEAEEPHGIRAVNHAVIVGQRKRQHLPGYKLVVLPYGLDRAARHTENRHLWLIDERREECAAQSTEIGDREDAARHFLEAQFL